MPQLVRAGKDVDGQLLVLVLVGRLSPREPCGILLTQGADERHAGDDRPERLTVSHVQLAAAAVGEVRAGWLSPARPGYEVLDDLGAPVVGAALDHPHARAVAGRSSTRVSEISSCRNANA